MAEVDRAEPHLNRERRRREQQTERLASRAYRRKVRFAVRHGDDAAEREPYNRKMRMTETGDWRR